jgi:hypothetical protein
MKEPYFWTKYDTYGDVESISEVVYSLEEAHKMINHSNPFFKEAYNCNYYENYIVNYDEDEVFAEKYPSFEEFVYDSLVNGNEWEDYNCVFLLCHTNSREN